MRKRWPAKSLFAYAALLLVCFLLALLVGWTAPAIQINGGAYDWMSRLTPPTPGPTHSVVLAIDDATLRSNGGMRRLRSILAEALVRISPAFPKAVITDILLVDRGDPIEDARLAEAFSVTHHLVLATDLVNGWELPLPRFLGYASGIGHVLADAESRDGVLRQISLETASGRVRHWSLSMEAFRLYQGAERCLESPRDVQVGDAIVPAPRDPRGQRSLFIRYLPEGVPRLTVSELFAHPTLVGKLTGKVVFIGVWSASAAPDRVTTPYGFDLGVDVNAEAFETLARRDFLKSASNTAVLAACAAIVGLAGLIFVLVSGRLAYLLAFALLLSAHLLPFLLFRDGIVFPFFAPAASAWLSTAAAATFGYFVVRRELVATEGERSRYRQALHWATHEMRSPLTAIQGSSELMGRYNLTDEKRKQIATVINSESKRLARMIQSFLDVERLSAGQMELKREPFDMREVVSVCLDRARSLAEAKEIALRDGAGVSGVIEGDRELMEYAVYNLLTNAIKYSPRGTEVAVESSIEGGNLRLSVADQGIGMEAKELRNLGRKFYRTARAEASGEAGTGIGLSLVQEIVQHHGGKMEVASSPNQGSCFTAVLPLSAVGRRSPAASTGR